MRWSPGVFTTEREETPFGDTENGWGKETFGLLNRITSAYHFYLPAHLVALSTFCPRTILRQTLYCNFTTGKKFKATKRSNEEACVSESRYRQTDVQYRFAFIRFSFTQRGRFEHFGEMNGLSLNHQNIVRRRNVLKPTARWIV